VSHQPLHPVKSANARLRIPSQERNLKMKVRMSLLSALAVLALSSLPASAEAWQQQTAPAQANPAATETATLPAQAQPQGSAPLRVMVGKSLLINTTEHLKRISVTDPASQTSPFPLS